MEVGKGRLSWLLPALALLAGCATVPPEFDRKLLADIATAAQPTAAYMVGCPDVLEVRIDARPDLGGTLEVGPDGCIGLGSLGRLRVEGKTTAAIEQLLATELLVPPAQVRVRVTAFQSQQVYLTGQVAGLQRVVPYCGPETVLEMLQRVGGVTPGAAPEDVYVVRGRVAEGKPPEVFHVDLRGVVLRHDRSTNVALQPFDQVYVGETRESCVKKCVPPVLRPLYDALCGLSRP